MVQRVMGEKSGAEKFMVKKSVLKGQGLMIGVEQYGAEKFMVEKSGLKGPGLRCPSTIYKAFLPFPI